MVFAQSEISWLGAVVLMTAVGLLLVGSGWLVVRVTRRGANGELGRNGWAGIRTRATLSSDEAWIAAQKAGAKPTILGGRLLIGTGIWSGLLGLTYGDTPDRAVAIWAVLVLVGTVVLLIFTLYGAWLGQAAAKAVQSEIDPEPA